MAKFRIEFKQKGERQKPAKTVEATDFAILEPFVLFTDGDIEIYAATLESVFSIERQEEK